MPALKAIELDLFDALGAANIGRVLEALLPFIISIAGTVTRVRVRMAFSWGGFQREIPQFIQNLPSFPAGLSADSQFSFRMHYAIHYRMHNLVWISNRDV